MRHRNIALIALAVLLIGALVMFNRAEDRNAPLVLAASSLHEALDEAAGRWAAQGHPRPVISYAASSALARQIAAGANADLFISADEPWMDEVQDKGLIRADSRRSFLTNRLVLVAPAGKTPALAIAQGFPLAQALGNGRLALADPEAVPAGKYAKASLTALGVWDAVKGRVAAGENVRAALAMVERGQAPLGIVYETDAKASAKVGVVGVFPPASHPPITYPLALLTTASPEAEGFRSFLLSPEATAIFARHGFGAR